MTDLFLTVDSGTIDWSRAQFALTAIYHWLFVPLTLGLAVIMGICETIYYRNRKRFWKDASRFWQKLFGINFAMGLRGRHVFWMEEGIAGLPFGIYLADRPWRYHLSMVDSGGQCMDAVSGGL